MCFLFYYVHFLDVLWLRIKLYLWLVKEAYKLFIVFFCIGNLHIDLGCEDGWSHEHDKCDRIIFLPGRHCVPCCAQSLHNQQEEQRGYTGRQGTSVEQFWPEGAIACWFSCDVQGRGDPLKWWQWRGFQ